VVHVPLLPLTTHTHTHTRPPTLCSRYCFTTQTLQGVSEAVTSQYALQVEGCQAYYQSVKNRTLTSDTSSEQQAQASHSHQAGYHSDLHSPYQNAGQPDLPKFYNRKYRPRFRQTFSLDDMSTNHKVLWIVMVNTTSLSSCKQASIHFIVS